MQQEEKDLFDDQFGDLLGDTNLEAPKANAAPRPGVNVVQTPVDVKKEPAAAPQPSAPVAPKRDPFGTVPFGTKISTVPIPRFKATKAIKSRVSFISKGVLPIKTHYVDGIGSFVCFEGKCCELEGLPKVRYILPVIVYETEKTGKPISQNISLQALVLGEDAYSALSDAVEFSGKPINEIDVIISCTDEGYQKLTFTVDNSATPQWKNYPQAKDLVAYYKENKSKLYMSVARTIEESTYLSRKGFVGPNQQAPQVDNPEDLLD